jgi:hypothetical protein
MPVISTMGKLERGSILPDRESRFTKANSTS